MARRRILLGSGLNADKLTETIRQMGLKDTLICDVPGEEHGWAHLRAHEEGWLLTTGYPSDEGPDPLLATRGIVLPEESQITGWRAGVYVAIRLPAGVGPRDLAGLIEACIRLLHGMASDSAVQISLEQG
ncbi:MAG: hypothetical protein Kow00124_04510 [Anaerolineae bacterium]